MSAARIPSAAARALCVAALAPLAACAVAQEAPDTALRASVVEARARIETIDPVARQIVLRLEDGSVASVEAGPEIRNFDRLEEGDTVLALIEERVALRMAGEGDIAETVGATMGARAEEGETPGLAVATAISTVVTVVGYDPASGVATFTTPEGETLSRVVAPEMRDFAEARSPGDRVFIEMSELVALGIEERAE